MSTVGERLPGPTTLRYVAILVMLAGLAIVAYLEATTEDGTIGIPVVAAGLVLSGVSHAMASRADDQSSSG